MGRRGKIALLTLFAAVVLVAGGCASDDETSVSAPDDTDAAVEELDADTAADDTDTAADHDDDTDTAADHDTDTDTAADHDTDTDTAADHDDDTDTAADHDDDTDTAADHDATEDTPAEDGVDLVIPVTMTEFAFEFDPVTIPVGSTVRFDFVNTGAIEHEAMFGDEHEQEEFAASDEGHGDHSDLEGHHGEIIAITLDAGATGSVVVTFDEPGEMIMGCHIAGHWDAGMHSTLTVV